MSQTKWVQKVSILILVGALLGLLPLVSKAITLDPATNITADSLDLSWSKSTSSNFSRYEIYQALEPINDGDPPAVPALSEWSVIALFFPASVNRNLISQAIS